MEYLVGVILGAAVAGFAATSGFDRDRAFYPTVLIVIASYYALFAVMGAPYSRVLGTEIAVGLLFAILAWLGFQEEPVAGRRRHRRTWAVRFLRPPPACLEPGHARLVAGFLRHDRYRARRLVSHPSRAPGGGTAAVTSATRSPTHPPAPAASRTSGRSLTRSRRTPADPPPPHGSGGSNRALLFRSEPSVY